MKEKHIPERKCIGCERFRAKSEMIRIVKNNENEVFIDGTKKAAGRGAYLCSDPACLAMAVKHRGLERSLKMKISPEIYEKLEKELALYEK